MSGSENSSLPTPKIIVKSGKHPLPVALVIKKNRSITIRANHVAKLEENFKLTSDALKNVLFKEDIIYESRPNDFLKGNPLEKIVIVNKLDRLANTSRTVVRYYSTSTNEILRELTSDNIVKLIGQNNYDTVFSSLCSVINQESKVRGILSLLTAHEDSQETLCKRGILEPQKIYEDKCCQTEEDCMDLLHKYKEGKKKRIRRSHLSPYVVTDNMNKPQKRIVIHPKHETHVEMIKKIDESKNVQSQCSSNVIEASAKDETVEQNSLIDSLPDFKNLIFNEDSNCSIGNLSVLSNFSADNLLEMRNPNELLRNVDRYTNTDSKIIITSTKSEAVTTEGSVNRENWPKITFRDGSEISVPVKPEDDFHIATSEILKHVSDKECLKLLSYQLYLDWKNCLQQDSDGYMPIHLAVINDDVDMLRRQCMVLRARQHTLDVVASDLTPLQMALLQDSPSCCDMVATLLRLGADPLLTDSKMRSPAHMAAEAPFGTLQAFLTHCRKEARSILEDHEELWKTEYSTKSDEELSRILLDHVCNAFNGQGYTPVMVASRHGLHRNVKLLLEASPTSVNTQKPNAGDTALYIAVGAACMNAIDRGNRSKVADHFKDTITTLVEAGADANLENLAGCNVNDLLSANNIPELSLLIGKKITSITFFNGRMPGDKKNSVPYMLEDNAGEVTIKELVDERKCRKSRAKGGGKAGGVRNPKVKVNETQNRNVKVNETQTLNVKVNDSEVSAKNADNNTVDNKTAIDKDHKTNVKPIILENIELPKTVATIHSNAVFINNSNVKFLKPQDKLEKISPNASVSATDIKNTSSHEAIQNLPKFNVTSNKNIIQSGDKKIVVVNFNPSSSIVGNTTMNSDFKTVTTGTVMKRTQPTTRGGVTAKKKKAVLNPTAYEKTM